MPKCYQILVTSYVCNLPAVIGGMSDDASSNQKSGVWTFLHATVLSAALSSITMMVASKMDNNKSYFGQQEYNNNTFG